MNEDDAVSGELRTVGTLGGVSSQSTVEYYQLIDEGINDVHGGHHVAEFLIRSINFGIVECYIRTERWDDAAGYLVAAATNPEAGGVGSVVMATNTMHRVASRIEAVFPILFLCIVDAAADAVLVGGPETVGVLGTRVMIDGAFYWEWFEEHGIDVTVLEESHRDEIDRIVFEELIKGETREASRDYYLKAVDQLVE